MTRSLIARIALAAGGLAVAAFALGCSGDDKTPAATPAAASTPVATQSSAAAPTPAPSTAAQPGPATFSVIGGRDEGAMDIEMFMPADIRIREGDSVEWTSKGYEGHTISFGTPEQIKKILDNYLVDDPDDPAQSIFNPEFALRTTTGDTIDGDGRYVNSGFIGVPTVAKYRLTFTKQGLYEYLCIVHPFTMRGSVAVNPANATVDSPETVAARGQADLARYMAIEKRALAEATDTQRTFASVGDASIHRVAVGVTTPFGQVAVFVPPVLDIRSGDSVVFMNDDRNFHNVTFKGAGEVPPGIGVKVDPDGRGINVALSKESAIAVDPPPSGPDPSVFFSSGTMGVTQPRLVWTVRFDKPGTYIYNCTIHVLAGMAGVINVR